MRINRKKSTKNGIQKIMEQVQLNEKEIQKINSKLEELIYDIHLPYHVKEMDKKLH